MPEIRLTWITCSACGKPRGLHHVCTRRRRGRDRIAPRLTVTRPCPHCGKPALNPFTHTCSKPSDFRKRKAARERAGKTAERKRKRRAAAARKRARAKERKRKAAERRRQAAAEAAARRKAARRKQSHDQERHEYETCPDPYCTKFGCRVYREGKEAGDAEGHASGFAEGYAAGMSVSA